MQGGRFGEGEDGVVQVLEGWRGGCKYRKAKGWIVWPKQRKAGGWIMQHSEHRKARGWMVRCSMSAEKLEDG